MNMYPLKAREIQRQIQDICDEHDIWFDVAEKYQPKLRDIEITVRIRVISEKKDIRLK